MKARRTEPFAALCPKLGRPKLTEYINADWTTKRGVLALWLAARKEAKK